MSACSLMFRKCTIKIKILIIIVMSQFVYSMHTEKFHQVSHGMGKEWRFLCLQRENSTESGGF